MLRAQHHRAAQHHQQHLLQKYLVKWKNYYRQCLGKKVRRISNLPSLRSNSPEVTGVGNALCSLVKGMAVWTEEKHDSFVY